MSKNGLLSEREETRLRNRRNLLKGELERNNRTVWEMVAPSLKTKEEIRKIKELKKEELEAITKKLNENSAKKRNITRKKNEQKLNNLIPSPFKDAFS